MRDIKKVTKLGTEQVSNESILQVDDDRDVVMINHEGDRIQTVVESQDHSSDEELDYEDDISIVEENLDDHPGFEVEA